MPPLIGHMQSGLSAHFGREADFATKTTKSGLRLSGLFHSRAGCFFGVSWESS